MPDSVQPCKREKLATTSIVQVSAAPTTRLEIGLITLHLGLLNWSEIITFYRDRQTSAHVAKISHTGRPPTNAKICLMT